MWQSSDLSLKDRGRPRSTRWTVVFWLGGLTDKVREIPWTGLDYDSPSSPDRRPDRTMASTGPLCHVTAYPPAPLTNRDPLVNMVRPKLLLSASLLAAASSSWIVPTSSVSESSSRTEVSTLPEYPRALSNRLPIADAPRSPLLRSASPVEISVASSRLSLNHSL
jgi:hypothetical protein